ncbi:MAG: hypothetical protein WCY89_06925 [Flavobacteriaceae bacterium]
MARQISADHILFNECIDTFRSEHNTLTFGATKSFLLLPFQLNQIWDLGICVIHPSTRMRLPGASSAFVSEVENPKWVGIRHAHLFGIALSTIISFITLKPCKSPRDGYINRKNHLSREDYCELSLINPILTAGPGAHTTLLSNKRLEFFHSEIKEFIDVLYKIDHKNFQIVMQGIRLLHLSLINKREDFGLAYLLAVSSIEAIAQKAIGRDKVKRTEPCEKEWKEKAKENEDFSKLFRAYKESRGKNEYLKERYVKFIFEYAPISNWEDYVSHPMQDYYEYNKETNSSEESTDYIKKSESDIEPKELEEKIINNILSDSYNHRSSYIHRGEQPPHPDPNPSSDRFFQKYYEYKNEKIEEKTLLTYDLLIGIAKNSFIHWIKTKL